MTPITVGDKVFFKNTNDYGTIIIIDDSNPRLYYVDCGDGEFTCLSEDVFLPNTEVVTFS